MLMWHCPHEPLIFFSGRFDFLLHQANTVDLVDPGRFDFSLHQGNTVHKCILQIMKQKLRDNLSHKLKNPVF